MKYNSLFYLVALFVLLNVMDIITTVFILPGESNPLYLLTKSFIVILLFKIFIVGIVVWIFYKNRYTTHRAYYLYIAILLYGTVALLLAQVINVYAIMHPAILQEAAAIPAEEKASSYYWFMNIIYLLPLIFSYLCFIIYEKSVNDAEFKIRKHWWEW